ncbi:hypothetical protein LCGC14_0400980 [marine sediment metagenome]|uniref:Uncharacterized protein n=1 Tax=marine sediment metagenome TaxID=412755 RepID=A0A0F9SWX0_9ZZZZ
MKARVKSDHRWNDVRCQAVEYIKSEWRPVPEGDEAVVRVNPGLEIKAAKKKAAKRKAAPKKKVAASA